MKNFLHLLGSIARTLLGIVFIFSGFVKAVDPLGTTYKIEDYLGAFGGFFNALTPLAEPAAWALIAFELVLGICLLLNLWRRVTPWLALAMMLVMTPLTLYLAIVNPISDCGCFGDAVVISNWATFWKNIVLLSLVIVLLSLNRFIPSVWRTMPQWIITAAALALAFGMMTYCRLHLPVMDFRPYKVGNNIPSLMEVPDDAPQDVYEVTFIYERDGEQREFSLSDYPKDDPSWQFVDQRSTLVQKGYEAPVHDFVIESPDFEDLTDDVLSGEKVVLCVCYKLEKTNMQQAARLADIATDAMLRGYDFYLLTGSGSDVIESFAEQTDYPYPIFTCDPVTLKTIVRANPGLVFLREGTVLRKYNLRDFTSFPEE